VLQEGLDHDKPLTPVTESTYKWSTETGDDTPAGKDQGA
jgi:hypothetical protein